MRPSSGLRAMRALIVLITSTFVLTTGPSEARAGTGRLDLRMLPASTLIPVRRGGGLREAHGATYVIGVGYDLARRTRAKYRWAWLNVSAYAVAVRWGGFETFSDIDRLQLGLLRAGPHLRWRRGLGGSSISLGAQLGYGAVLHASALKGELETEHGFEAGLTLSLTDFGDEDDPGDLPFSAGMFTAGLVMMAVAGALGYGATRADDGRDVALGLGAAGLGTAGAIVFGLSFGGGE